MKISIQTYIYQYYPIEEALRRIEEHGYDAMEIVGCRPHAYPLDLNDEHLKDLKEKISQTKLELACYTPKQAMYPVNISSPIKKISEDTVKYLKRGVRIASSLGAPLMVVLPGHSLYGQPLSEAWKTTVKNVRRVAREAADFGLSLALEPLTPLESNLVSTVDQALKMREDVGAENFGFMIDAGHSHVLHESLTDAILKFGKRLLHVHLSDNNGSADSHLPPGRGTVPYERFLYMLKKSGYDRFLSVEPGFQFSEDPDTIAAESIRYVKNILAQLGRSP